MRENKLHFKSRDCGGVGAWSLHNPALPEYGQWVWLQIVGDKVSFIMDMTEAEVAHIRQHYTIWGAHWPGTSWAIVLGTLGGSDVGSSNTPLSPNRSVGV